MPTTLNGDQVAAIGKLNRQFAILRMTLTEHPGTKECIIVHMTLKAGKSTIEREFVMDSIGGLMRDESNAALT